MDVRAFWELSYGVYIVGAMDGPRPTGCVANSMMQITAEPASIAVSINHNNYTCGLIEKTGRFSIMVCSEKMPPLTIGTFGFRSGRDCNKFDAFPYVMKDGVPVLKEGLTAWLTCEVINKMETATHTVFLGKVLDAEKLPDAGEPMTYAYYHRVIKGRAPKNAPTYIDAAKLN